MHRLHIKILTMTLIFAFATAHAVPEEATFKQDKVTHKSGGLSYTSSAGIAAVLGGIYWKARRSYPNILVAEAGVIEYGGYVAKGIIALISWLKNIRKTQTV